MTIGDQMAVNTIDNMDITAQIIIPGDSQADVQFAVQPGIIHHNVRAL